MSVLHAVFRRSSMPMARPWVCGPAWLSLLVTLWLCAGGAFAFERLTLRNSQLEADPWPVLTVWAEAAAIATVDQVLERRGHFKRPQSQKDSFGTLPGVLWLRVPLRLESAGAQWAGDVPWWLRIPAPGLDRVDVWLIESGQVVDHQVTGEELVCAARPLCASGQVVPLRLQPERDYELLLRVRATSGWVIPLRVLHQDRFVLVERHAHLLMGLVLGVWGVLLIYALSHAWAGRNVEFGLVAVLVLGASGSFLCQSGMGEHLLWPDSLWMMRKGPLMADVLSLVAVCLLLDRVLEGPRLHRLGSWCLRGVAVLGSLCAVLGLVGSLEAATADLALTLLGQVSLLEGAVLAWRRVRCGDRPARLVVAERLLQCGATAVFAGLVMGVLPANFWTQQSLAMAALASGILYCAVAAQRAEVLHAVNLQTRHCQDQLMAQAHKDALTGLLGPRGLHVQLEQALATRSSQQWLALYLINLDGFKSLNRSRTPAVGDALLVAVAHCLVRLVRAGDLVARRRGDEFVVVAAMADIEAAQRLGQALLGVGMESHDLGVLHCRVGVTVGCVWCYQSSVTATDLLAQAETALRAGKQRGGGCLMHAGAAKATVIDALVSRQAKPQEVL